jgi:NADH-quinone oxidoreductase subunit G
VVFDGERCILCTRCIRFCDEITGTSELTTEQRGDHTEITTFPGRELDNAYSMCVTDLCPVGALTTRDFRFKTRVWLLSSTDSLCTGCSRGCNIHMEHHQGEVKRYRPRLNPEVNEYWMCDEGRLSYQHHKLGRTTAIRLRDQREVQWPRAARQTAEALTAAVATANGQVAMLTSPQLSCESLLAAREFAASVLGNATVYVGGNPSGGNDAFLITSDKNPNRAGVVQVFGPAILSNTAYKLLEEMEQGRVQALYLMRGELPFDTAGRARFVRRQRGALESRAAKDDVIAFEHYGLAPDRVVAQQRERVRHVVGVCFHSSPFSDAFWYCTRYCMNTTIANHPRQ